MKKILVVILLSVLVGAAIYYLKSNEANEHESCTCISCSEDGCEGAENCAIESCEPKN